MNTHGLVLSSRPALAAAAGFLLLAASPAWAGNCGVATVDTYVTSGFTCTIGALQFSNFQWSTDLVGSSGNSTNLPNAITVTPQNGVGGIGFLIGNIGLSTTAKFSITDDDFFFNVNALSGNIVGASLALGTHGAVGPAGLDVAFFQDLASNFLLTVVDPIPWPEFGSFYNTVRTSQSATFPGITGGTLFSGAGSIVRTFDGGSATLDSYTVLLQTSAPGGAPDVVPGAAVPEPASLGLFGAGLALLGAMLRWKNAGRASRIKA